MKLREGFRRPGKEFGAVPFWSWNDDLADKELCRQVREMKRAGLGGFFMHSRIGLITPYLSKEWMNRVRAVVRESRRVGMNAWLYDEDRWPSGFAGGIVPAKGPEYRTKRVECEERQTASTEDLKKDEEIIGAFICTKDGDQMRDIQRIRDEIPENVEGKTTLIFRKKIAENSDWYNGYSYIDTLNPEVVDAFIESTYEAYKKEFQREFGKTIPGIFTDEPNYSQWDARAAIPWTEQFPVFFKERDGYDISDKLPSLFYDVGDYMKIRRDFWNAITDLFLESYSKRIYEWCEDNKLKYTGHYLCEDNLVIQTKFIGAAMPHYEYMHVPGIDHLGRNINDLMTVKQISSAAHQLGKKRVLSETYGCGGWNLSFDDQKWIGDWQYVLGVNLLNQHLSLYSLKGCRKRDFPPSINYQQPWWRYYKHVSNYFARLSYMLTQGRFVADILVIHPIQSAWSVYNPRDISQADELNASFVYISESLCKIHRDYDYGDEKIIAKHGKVEGNRIRVGEMVYRLVIIPPSTTLQASTLNLLKQFVEAGGKLIAVKPTPQLVDCRRSDDIAKLIESIKSISCDKDELRRALDDLLPHDVEVKDERGQPMESVYYQHRVLGKSHIYFLANTDQSRAYDSTIILRGEGRVEEWNPLKGSVREMECRTENRFTILKNTFQSTGSLLLVLDTSKKAKPKRQIQEKTVSTIDLQDTWKISRNKPNALTLDYCQYRLEGREWSERLPVWKVQREAEILGREVKISLRYVFTTEFAKRRKQRKIFLVMETPEKYELTLNGKKVKYRKAGWWIDMGFKKIDVSKLVVNGQNTLEVACPFRRPTILGTLVFLKDGVELESVYITGDFAVKKTNEGFILTDETKTVQAGDLVQQGLPFYAGTVTYTQTVNVRKADKTYIEFESLDTIVTKVSANGKEAGIILWKPYKIDISRFMRKGRNTITVEAVSSCRNLLGPHHHTAGELLSVSPGSFSDEAHWTDDYSFVRFGIGKARLIQTKIQ